MKPSILKIAFFFLLTLAGFTSCNCPHAEGISQEQFRQMLLNGEVIELTYVKASNRLELVVSPELPYHHHSFFLNVPEGLSANVLLQDIRHIIDHLPIEQQINIAQVPSTTS